MTARINKQDTRLQEVEAHTLTTEDELVTLGMRLKKMEAELLHVAAKNEDLEGCLRRNNIRNLGVAEATAAGATVTYVEKLLTDLFGKDNFSTCLLVERVHRSLGPRPLVGAPANYCPSA